MARIFTDRDLYVGGRPRSRDIEQDEIGDCFLLATAGAIADQQPDLIRIHYDAKTTEFNVSLFKEGKRVDYAVTQAELRENFTRQGGSTYDNRGVGPIWPAVLEVAYAKSLDRNPADGLSAEWDELDQGGRPIDAMQVLTGEAGSVLSRPMVASIGTEQTVRSLNDALGKRQPVTLVTGTELGRKQDRLIDDHAYVVERAYVSKQGEAMVTLRNPWGANIIDVEGAEPRSLKLDTLLSTGGLSYFNIGPAPMTVRQDSSATPSSSLNKQPAGLRQVADLLNDMVRDLAGPNGDAKLAGKLQGLRELSAGELYREGSIELERSSVQARDDSSRMTPRQSEGRSLRIGM
jgi:hypothetical protein